MWMGLGTAGLGPGPGAPLSVRPSPRAHAVRPLSLQAGAALLQRQRPVLPGAEPVLCVAAPVPGVPQRHPAARGRAGLHGALPARGRVPPVHRRVAQHLPEPAAVPPPQVSAHRGGSGALPASASLGAQRLFLGVRKCWAVMERTPSLRPSVCPGLSFLRSGSPLSLERDGTLFTIQPLTCSPGTAVRGGSARGAATHLQPLASRPFPRLVLVLCRTRFRALPTPGLLGLLGCDGRSLSLAFVTLTLGGHWPGVRVSIKNSAFILRL